MSSVIKNNQSIIVAGIALIAALAFFDTLRKKPNVADPKSLIPREELQQINEAQATFQEGMAEFKDQRPADQACSKYSGAAQAICFNGYFVSANAWNMQHQSGTEVRDLDADIPSLGKDPKLVDGLWYASLGTALSQLNVSPKMVEKFIGHKDMWPNIVDGWAFAELQKSGFQDTLDTCAAEYDKKALRACYFGMGRASFFSRKELESGHAFPKELIDGFLYTKFFVQPAPEHPTQASFVAKMDLAGAVTQWMWADNKKDLAEFKEMHACLSQRHPVECD